MRPRTGYGRSKQSSLSPFTYYFEDGEHTHTILVGVVELSGAEDQARRTGTNGNPAEAFYDIKSGEHFDVGSEFEFRLDGGRYGDTPFMRYELWDTWTVPTLLKSGSGTSFPYVFSTGTDEGGVYVRFYVDRDNDGSFTDFHGEEQMSSPVFLVQQRKLYDIEVDVSKAISPLPNYAAVLAVIEAAEDLLLKKDSALDYRACVDFQLSASSYSTFTPSPSQPDPVESFDQAALHTDGTPADIVFVEDIDIPGFDIGGLSRFGEWGTTLIQWPGPRLAKRVAHEIGHWRSIQHHDDEQYVMHPRSLGNHLSQVAANQYD